MINSDKGLSKDDKLYLILLWRYKLVREDGLYTFDNKLDKVSLTFECNLCPSHKGEIKLCEINPANIYYPPEYIRYNTSEYDSNYDCALIKLDEPLNDHENFQPSCLCTVNDITQV